MFRQGISYRIQGNPPIQCNKAPTLIDGKCQQIDIRYLP